ncbi:hypothetical protein BCR32DRAFT_298190 [Anaeromyces robustus]|uniref:Methyltransferase domain-containing protein n=2 Tax=Anaeromyces robustus TaxID=1754192 RepID=A0A1Y1VS76_9FUNG|nr:hypothetical protein BCR32DRAFT_298190 [Anaeromyces robustus]|eukprot:ORX64138.1 hypothetical protein BCR32DRAFT_298190 [Anaeromyces robustus]
MKNFISNEMESDNENDIDNDNEENNIENKYVNYIRVRDVYKRDIEFSKIILENIPPTVKRRRSFLSKNGVRIDMTVFNDISQLEIELANNVNQEKEDIVNRIHTIMFSLDCSNFVLDYLFSLLRNFEFQKPITPSLDILFKEAENLIHGTFYVAAKTDGFRRLIIIINNLMFSISENLRVEYVGQSRGKDCYIVFDCEFINDIFISFDVIYYNDDLRNKSYSDRVSILNKLNFQDFNNKIVKKDIIKCFNFADLQNFVISMTKENDTKSIPNDGIIITDGRSSYYDNLNVYKIKTINTVDLRFDGRYFYAKKTLVKKTKLNLSLPEYKKVCQLYHQHKKLYYKKDESNENNPTKVNTNHYYYKKQIENVNYVLSDKRDVRYRLVREKKIPFIVEINLDNKTLVKVRKDKYTSNSINTFNSILIASYQKINIEIFLPVSTVLMRKYHNRIKQNILNKYRGTLLDIGTGNGGDIHKWKNFRKIVCVEPDHEKIKVLNERVSKSEIRNRISILQNTIENVKLDNTYDVVSCFFTLNDLTYTSIFDMLENISKNINGIFSVVFFDYDLFTENINSSSITYKKCIDSETGNFTIEIDKSSPIYLLSYLRYAHSECDNIMYINIANSYITNKYENGINGNHVKKIFEKYGFKILNEYTIDTFPFLDESQILYTSNIKVIEFSNINNNH